MREEVFNQMHRELRAHNRDIPESADRLDPMLRIMLELYAGQLADIDQRVDSLWTVASNALTRSLYPETTRWPVPAYTVMKCDVSDPVVEIDRHTQFYYRERRDDGRTFYFAPQRSERIVRAEVAKCYCRIGSTVQAVRPDKSLELAQTADDVEYYVAVRFDGEPSALTDATLYLQTDARLAKQLQWGSWFPSAASGDFYADARFCPGLTVRIEELVGGGDEAEEWGGLRSHADLFRQLAPHFVKLPADFCATWQLAPTDGDLEMALAEGTVAPDEDGERFLWIKIVLPPGGDRQAVASRLAIHFGCLVATNRQELTQFKHTGGNRVVDVEIPEGLDQLLRIRSVVDSNGKEYVPSYRLHMAEGVGVYGQEERNNRAVLRFDFADPLETPPDSITVRYEITESTRANGIEPGQIDDLYEKHPGVKAVVNLTPVVGGVPAKSEEDVVTEVVSRLRGRDRALSFDDISRWARTFDPRIKTAVCGHGVQRSAHGVRRCVVVTIGPDRKSFHSDEELALLQERLAAFLKSRAPLNTWFRVELDD